MNPVKAQIKIGTYYSLGSKFDDQLEAAQKDVYRYEGIAKALEEVQRSTLPSVLERVDADRDEGKFDLEVGVLIKDYLTKVHLALDNARIHNEKYRLIAEGRVAGLTLAVQTTKKAMDAEKAKLETLATGLANGSIAVGDEDAPVRPPPVSALDDLNQRREAARLAREGQDIKSSTSEAQESADSPTKPAEFQESKSSVSPPTVPGPRRGRPKGSKNKSKVPDGQNSGQVSG